MKYLVTSSSNLQSGGDDQEQQKAAAMLEKSIYVMRNIINELSEVTRIENNYNEEAEKVRLEDIINEVRLTLNDQILSNKAKIRLDIKEPEIIFSRKNIRNIIYNLVSNAIKYRSPDRRPEIYVKSKKADGLIQISVKDNGIGIDEDKKGLLFPPGKKGGRYGYRSFSC